MPNDRIEINETRGAEHYNGASEQCLCEVLKDQHSAGRQNRNAGERVTSSSQRTVDEQFGAVEIHDPHSTPRDNGVGQNIGPHMEPIGGPHYPVGQRLGGKDNDPDVLIDDIQKSFYRQHPSEQPQWQPAGGSPIPPVYQHLRRTPQPSDAGHR